MRNLQLFHLILIICFSNLVKGCQRTRTVYKYRDPPPLKPPQFKNCPQSGDVYYADWRRTRTTVQYSPPKGDIGTATLKYAKLTVNGVERWRVNDIQKLKNFKEEFQGSTHGQTHHVMYEAEDRNGLKVFCSISFIVKVRACDTLPRPDNGKIDCDREDSIYGTTCKYRCDEGFERDGPTSFECQENGSWTKRPVCRKIQCPHPPAIANGDYICDNDYYDYETRCDITCKDGFDLKPPRYVLCKSDRQWLHGGASVCKDTAPPKLECQPSLIFYADYGVMTARVSWQEPTATDNVDRNPKVIRMAGPSPGDALEVGSKYVEYKAKDSEGNMSPTCSIELRVKAITCKHPLDVIKDDNMKIHDCSDSTYHFGVTCYFSCQYNLPLEGTNSTKMICQRDNSTSTPSGYWQFGNGSIPRCRVVMCPALDPPNNGALSYETVNTRPVVIVMCNENYDIPRLDFRFDGQIFCYDSGTWFPTNKTPDCTESRRANRMRLPSELYYYSGSCPDEETQEEIKENFLTILSTVNQQYNKICPGDVTCTVDAVSVSCGVVHDRERREIDFNFISNHNHYLVKREESNALVFAFDIITTFEQGEKTINEVYDITDNIQAQQKEVFSDLVRNGTFDIEDLTLKPDSFQAEEYGEIACDPGFVFDKHICKACPRGMYSEANQCLKCPRGQYTETEGADRCQQCPGGHSTVNKGSMHKKDCARVCTAGTYSLTRLAPCGMCPAGTYQPDIGAIMCIPCPHGQTTSLDGSTDPEQCQDFDILLGNTEGFRTLGDVYFPDSLTVLFWSRPYSQNSSHTAVIRLLYEDTYLLRINISESFTVEIGNEVDATFPFPSNSWKHVSVVYDRKNSSMIIYVNGEIQFNATLASAMPINASVAIAAEGTSGIYLSGLHILSRGLHLNDISSLQTTCTPQMMAEVSMDDIIGLQFPGINIVTPAICDAIDECASMPCGEHECVNGYGNFTCICKNGMSGGRCELAPDYCLEHECLNEAICNNNKKGYNCTCVDGYTGPFCETPPVNGNWSYFEEWSECTATCDGGTRTRTRSCDNPAPSYGGLNCSGDSTETEPCNTEICKECKTPRESLGVIINCTVNNSTKMIVCIPYCREYFMLPPGLLRFESYSCGPDTDYIWTPFENFPACIAPEPPKRYSFDVEVPYNSIIADNQSASVESSVRHNLAQTKCSSVSTCDMSVSVTGRTVNETGSKLAVSFGIPITNITDLGPDIEKYAADGTISPAIQEVIDAVVALEESAADILANSSTFFNVEIEGETFTIPETNLTLTGSMDCVEGSVPADGACVPCPYGSRALSDYCLDCPIGTYQDEEGKMVCKHCPDGTTTHSIGAVNISDCLSVPKPTIPEPTDHKSEEIEVEPLVNTTVVAGICAVVLSIVVGSILIAYKMWNRRRNRKSFRLTVSTSLALDGTESRREEENDDIMKGK